MSASSSLGTPAPAAGAAARLPPRPALGPAPAGAVAAVVTHAALGAVSSAAGCLNASLNCCCFGGVRCCCCFDCCQRGCCCRDARCRERGQAGREAKHQLLACICTRLDSMNLIVANTQSACILRPPPHKLQPGAMGEGGAPVAPAPQQAAAPTPHAPAASRWGLCQAPSPPQQQLEATTARQEWQRQMFLAGPDCGPCSRLLQPLILNLQPLQLLLSPSQLPLKIGGLEGQRRATVGHCWVRLKA